MKCASLLLAAILALTISSVQSDSNGGYREDTDSFVHSDVCNIEVRDDLSEEEFLLHYYKKKPVIVNGELSSWRARKLWTRDNMLKVYGKSLFNAQLGTVAADKVPLSKVLASQEDNKKKRQLVNNLDVSGGEEAFPHGLFPYYIFDHRFLYTKKRQSEYRLPSLFRKLQQRIIHKYFSIGPSYSGTFFHQHGSALSATVFGKKRWFLIPEEAYTILSSGRHTAKHFVDGDYIHPVEWLLRHYETLYKGKVHECVVNAGQMLYIPEMWAHAVINIGETVGVAFELSHSTQHFSIENGEIVTDAEITGAHGGFEGEGKGKRIDKYNDKGEGEGEDEDVDEDELCEVKTSYGGVKVAKPKPAIITDIPQPEASNDGHHPEEWIEIDELDGKASSDDSKHAVSPNYGYDAPSMFDDDDEESDDGSLSEDASDVDLSYKVYSPENPITEEEWLEELSSD